MSRIKGRLWVAGGASGWGWWGCLWPDGARERPADTRGVQHRLRAQRARGWTPRARGWTPHWALSKPAGVSRSVPMPSLASSFAVLGAVAGAAGGSPPCLPLRLLPLPLRAHPQLPPPPSCPSPLLAEVPEEAQRPRLAARHRLQQGPQVRAGGGPRGNLHSHIALHTVARCCKQLPALLPGSPSWPRMHGTPVLPGTCLHGWAPV